MPKSPEIISFLEALRSEDSPRPLPAGSPRAVIDTNVLMDFWHFHDQAAAPLLELLESGAFIALRDAETENEFAEVIGRAQFSVPLEAQKRILALWHRTAWPVPEVRRASFGCSDPLDQKLFDLSVAGNAALLVTKDRQVLKAGRRAKKSGLLVLTPEQAAEMIQSSRKAAAN